jgi:hypothetical protein
MLMPPADEPYDVKLDLAAKSLAEYASAAWSGNVPDQARRAGKAVFARDVYGSRFLVAAPFGYGDPDGSAGLDVVDVDHWYAWDIDMCGLDVAAGAGAFGSAEEALAEWREASGLRRPGPCWRRARRRCSPCCWTRAWKVPFLAWTAANHGN